MECFGNLVKWSTNAQVGSTMENSLFSHRTPLSVCSARHAAMGILIIITCNVDAMIAQIINGMHAIQIHYAYEFPYGVSADTQTHFLRYICDSSLGPLRILLKRKSSEMVRVSVRGMEVINRRLINGSSTKTAHLPFERWKKIGLR